MLRFLLPGGASCLIPNASGNAILSAYASHRISCNWRETLSTRIWRRIAFGWRSYGLIRLNWARSAIFRRRALRIIDVTTGSLDKFPPVVLIVEDDSLLRMFAVEVVAEAGFVPVEAGDADEAVTLLEARPDISLQFTDINMPGSMGGVRRPLSSFAQTCCK
jgi:hypothetical protein